tara:strand:- start:106 stop:579 length:474 start_codon:yes stop_codon:yes gene_type:complete
MRKVFFVPEGQDINDYKDQWNGQVKEVHNSVSVNNKDYILTDKEAHFFKIPEFQAVDTVEHCSSLDYIIYSLIDDYAEFEDDPAYIMEIWEKDYDNPNKDKVKKDTHILGYNKNKGIYETDYIRLDAGWYDLVFKKDNELFDTSEVSVYYKEVEEEE